MVPGCTGQYINSDSDHCYDSDSSNPSTSIQDPIEIILDSSNSAACFDYCADYPTQFIIKFRKFQEANFADCRINNYILWNADKSTKCDSATTGVCAEADVGVIYKVEPELSGYCRDSMGIRCKSLTHSEASEEACKTKC